jgi:hypothetical protein
MQGFPGGLIAAHVRGFRTHAIDGRLSNHWLILVWVSWQSMMPRINHAASVCVRFDRCHALGLGFGLSDAEQRAGKACAVQQSRLLAGNAM